MTRKGEINAANPYAGSSEIAYGKKIGFIIGAEWADAHPNEVDNDCKFCKQEEVITHKSRECDLSYEDETLCVDVDMPLTWGSATGIYGFSINYCPMCGRKLSK